MNLSFRQALDLENGRLVDVKDSTADLRVFATYIGPTRINFSMLKERADGTRDPRIAERERKLLAAWKKSDSRYYKGEQSYLEFS